jgi:hypothetical protein
MVLALSMSGSAILLPVSTIGDEDGAATTSPRTSGWAARDVFAAEPSEKAVGARIVADGGVPRSRAVPSHSVARLSPIGHPD